MRRTLLAVLVLMTGACGGDEWTGPVSTTTTFPVAPDVPLVLTRHESGGDTGSPGNCQAYDYVGVPDGAGGTRPDYRATSPDEALAAVLRTSSQPALPPGGYHWVGRPDGGVFVYVSGGRVEATVEIDAAAGRYGATTSCGSATGLPDAAWRPPPPPPPFGSTPDEQRLQAANRALFDALPPVPGARLASSGPATGTARAEATSFHFELTQSRCRTAQQYERLLAAAGFTGQALETTEPDGDGTMRVGTYAGERGSVVVTIRTREPGRLVVVVTTPAPPVDQPVAPSSGCTVD